MHNNLKNINQQKIRTDLGILKAMILLLPISCLILLVFQASAGDAGDTGKTGAPIIYVFQADPAIANPGENVTLSWNVSNVVSLSIDPGDIHLEASRDQSAEKYLRGYLKVRPVKSTNYTLKVENLKGNTTANATVMIRAQTAGSQSQSASVPAVSYFLSSPSRVMPGNTAVLSWSVSGANEVIISGIGKVALAGSYAVSPVQSTVYTLAAKNEAGTVTALARVDVEKPQISRPVVNYFNAYPAVIERGDNSALSWSVSGAQIVNLEGVGNVGPSGSLEVSPRWSTTYTLRASNSAGSIDASARVDVREKPSRPVIHYFGAGKQVISRGDSTVLSWGVSGASTVSISGIGQVSSSGSKTVRPYSSTSYTLTATNQGGTAREVIFIEVGEVAIQPIEPVVPGTPEEGPIHLF